MTEDQQDINTEDVEQDILESSDSVDKLKSKKKRNHIIDAIVLIFIVLLSCILVAPYYSYYQPSFHDVYEYERHEEYCLLQSLQSAAAIYVAMQRTPPVDFSDFVTVSENAEDPYTLSVKMYEGSFEGFDTKKLKHSFSNGDEYAVYYLNGTDVTVQFSFDEKTKKDIAKFEKSLTYSYPMTCLFYLFIIFCISYVLNWVYMFITKTIWGYLLFVLLICVILALYRGPSYTVHKPAIYLYPTEPTMVNVKIDEDIDLSLDIPKYPPGKGWNVLAQPDGKIVDLQLQYTDCNTLDSNRFGMEYAKDACLQNNYPYIYWEGTPKTKQLPPQTKGWMVNKSDTRAFLETKLDYAGFNKTEKDEFIRYWAHKIGSYNKETVFISFMQTAEVDAYHSMTITPTPDSINRFYIVVDLNVDRHLQPKSQKLKKFKRKGFTVVDWGGCVIDK